VGIATDRMMGFAVWVFCLLLSRGSCMVSIDSFIVSTGLGIANAFRVPFTLICGLTLALFYRAMLGDAPDILYKYWWSNDSQHIHLSVSITNTR